MTKPPTLIPTLLIGAALMLPGLAPAQIPAQPAAQTNNEPIYGSQMMTQQERNEYRERMRQAQTREERERVRQEHHERMKERAKARGVNLPDSPPPKGLGYGPGGVGKGPNGMGRPFPK